MPTLWISGKSLDGTTFGLRSDQLEKYKGGLCPAVDLRGLNMIMMMMMNDEPPREE